MGFMLLGKKGEEIAKWYLQSKGYLFLEENFTTRWGEIDLIMKKDGQIIFVEVKTRSRNNLVTSNRVLSERKISRLERAAEIYLTKQKCADWQFILVAVTVEKQRFFIKLINL